MLLSKALKLFYLCSPILEIFQHRDQTVTSFKTRILWPVHIIGCFLIALVVLDTGLHENKQISNSIIRCLFPRNASLSANIFMWTFTTYFFFLNGKISSKHFSTANNLLRILIFNTALFQQLLVYRTWHFDSPLKILSVHSMENWLRNLWESFFLQGMPCWWWGSWLKS